MVIAIVDKKEMIIMIALLIIGTILVVTVELAH